MKYQRGYLSLAQTIVVIEERDPSHEKERGK